MSSSLLFTCALSLTACSGQAAKIAQSSLASTAVNTAAYLPDLGNDPLTGDITPVHDPSLIRQGNTWYVFSTDLQGPIPAPGLAIRCSTDRVAWRDCGYVFDAPPAWVRAKIPGLNGLWAPDVSYFNGLYHVYYAGSTLTSQTSVLGLATSPTLNPADPAYHWTDRGEVMESSPGDDFNAIDANILVDTDGKIWLSYGSYWSGIKQREVDPATGMPVSGGRRYDLAARPDVPVHPIEAASLIHHGSYYYLFVSIDYCCNPDVTTDNYKEAVGRSTSPHGPFVNNRGDPMLSGASTVILAGNSRWAAPGGGTAYVDPATGDALFTFHALDRPVQYATTLWVNSIDWVDDWPVLH